jgi:soluble lytic murein transglycosylase
VIQELTLPLRHEDIIRQQSRDKDVDASLIAAVIYAESRFSDQTSHAGARGLMQITPLTAREIEKLSGGSTFEIDDLSDPDLNIRYGTFYLRELLDRYDGNEVAALAAYNAGPGNAEEWGGAALTLDDIPLDETQDYVAEVLDKQDAYRDEYARELGY